MSTPGTRPLTKATPWSGCLYAGESSRAAEFVPTGRRESSLVLDAGSEQNQVAVPVAAKSADAPTFRT